MRAGFTIMVLVMLGLTVVCKAADSYQGQESKMDSLTGKPIYFRMSSDVIDPAYRQNRQAIADMDYALTNKKAQIELDSVIITAYSSPDGSFTYNSALSKRRSISVKEYIKNSYPLIDQSKVFTRSYVESWQSLQTMISADKTKYYSQIIAILNQRLSYQTTEQRLKMIDGGGAWKQIVGSYLPKMRMGATCVIYAGGEIITKDSKQDIEESAPASVPMPTSDNKPIIIEIVPPLLVVTKQYNRPLFALKTNLLYDAVTAINIEIEVPIGNHWSIAGEYIFPWWRSDKHQRAFESLSGFMEVKYWFGHRNNRRQLTGWFAGIYGGGGKFDVEWSSTGYQGNFFIPAALSGGYAHVIGRNLSLEYSLGVGYMQSKYRKYNATICADETMRLIKSKEGTHKWFGPTKAKISLVWLINCRRGGVR